MLNWVIAAVHAEMLQLSLMYIRDPPIMLKILPIMLCCTTQNFYLLYSNYAQALCLIGMPHFPCLSNKFAVMGT